MLHFTQHLLFNLAIFGFVAFVVFVESFVHTPAILKLVTLIDVIPQLLTTVRIFQ